MLVFVVTGAIAGMLLGVRFKVLVLVPAFLVAAVVISLNGSGHTLSSIVLTVLATVVSLQIGYIIGSVLERRAHLPAAQRHQRVRFALARTRISVLPPTNSSCAEAPDSLDQRWSTFHAKASISSLFE
jgi:hypothetical protein